MIPFFNIKNIKSSLIKKNNQTLSGFIPRARPVPFHTTVQTGEEKNTVLERPYEYSFHASVDIPSYEDLYYPLRNEDDGEVPPEIEKILMDIDRLGEEVKQLFRVQIGAINQNW